MTERLPIRQAMIRRDATRIIKGITLKMSAFPGRNRRRELSARPNLPLFRPIAVAAVHVICRTKTLGNLVDHHHSYS